MKKILFVCSFFILLPSSCKTELIEYLEIPINYRDEIKASLISDKFIIYYHSGDCSICFGTLLEISEELPNLNIISITSSQNRVLLEYQLEEIKFKGISLNDSDSLFYRQNQKILKKGNLFLVDSVYHILVLSAGFNKDFTENIKKQLD